MGGGGSQGQGQGVKGSRMTREGKSRNELQNGFSMVGPYDSDRHFVIST